MKQIDSIPTAPSVSLLIKTSAHNDIDDEKTLLDDEILPPVPSSLSATSEQHTDLEGIESALTPHQIESGQNKGNTLRKPSHMRGLLFVLISGVLFSAMNIAISMISRGPNPAHPLLTVVIRFSMQFILSAIAICFMRRDKIHLPNTWFGARDKRFKICMRGVWGVGGLTGWFMALSSMPIADATAIVFINIPLAAIFAHLVLGEAYTVADATAGLLALLGVVLVCQPSSLFGSAVGSVAAAPLAGNAVAVALAGCVCSAMAFVAARRVGPDVDTLVIVLLFAVLGCVVMPPAAALAGAFERPPSGRDWLLMLLAGGSGWVGQLFLNAGMQQAPAGPAAVMRYMDLIISIIWQSFYLGEVPNALKLIGSVLVMSTMGSTLYKERIKHLATKKKTTAIGVKEDNSNSTSTSHVVDDDDEDDAALKEWYSREN